MSFTLTNGRTRYRPSLKAQTIAQFTRPEADQAQPGYAAPRAGLPNAACTVPTMHKLLNGATSLSQSILASHLDPRNPFISWYALKAESRDEDKTPGSRLPLKEEVIHVDFLRVAKVLVRRTYVDRERLAWLEYWLGYRQEALHITDMLSHDQYSKSTTIGLQYEQQTSRTGSLANIEESGSVRPDVRDVWDVLEDQVGRLLIAHWAGLQADRHPRYSWMRSWVYLSTRKRDASCLCSSKVCTIPCIQNTTTRIDPRPLLIHLNCRHSTSKVERTNWAQIP